MSLNGEEISTRKVCKRQALVKAPQLPNNGMIYSKRKALTFKQRKTRERDTRVDHQHVALGSISYIGAVNAVTSTVAPSSLCEMIFMVSLNLGVFVIPFGA